MNADGDTGLRKKEAPGEAAPNTNRLPRIVMVWDNRPALDCLDMVIRSLLGDVTLGKFDNATDALEELSIRDPDLLVTYDLMPIMRGRELCQHFLNKAAPFPIIVISALYETERWVQEFATQGLNVTFLAVPFDIADFRRLLVASLNIAIEPVLEQHSLKQQ